MIERFFPNFFSFSNLKIVFFTLFFSSYILNATSVSLYIYKQGESKKV